MNTTLCQSKALAKQSVRRRTSPVHTMAQLKPFVFTIAALLLVPVALKLVQQENTDSALPIETGTASYYGREFSNKPTASGERFDPSKLTAAHPSLPLGSRVSVTNTKNGRSVTVRINDRGPYVGGRIIDLSEAAAKKLGFKNDGLAAVTVMQHPRG